MYHAEDVFLKNKVEEIDQLPAGYQPDLQSKWNFLETAMEGKKSSKIFPNFVRFGIAATVSLLIGLGIWINYYTNSSGTKPSGNIVADQPSINDDVKFKSIPVPSSASVKNSKKVFLRKRQHQLNSNLHLLTKPNSYASSHDSKQDEPKVKPQIPIEHAAEFVSISSNTPITAKRKRYVQIDFGSEEALQKSISASAGSDPGFRLRILPSETPASLNTVKYSSPSIRLVRRF
ncbi:MAG: hypothetical protein IPG90_12455 [Bacteroidetes bacterium]|nr:hypothetical protein [Bacteroidota bacterium]